MILEEIGKKEEFGNEFAHVASTLPAHERVSCILSYRAMGEPRTRLPGACDAPELSIRMVKIPALKREIRGGEGSQSNEEADSDHCGRVVRSITAENRK